MPAKYRIKIDYETGDSFGSEKASEYLDLTWENIDVAKENLQFIKEHYEQYRGINVYSSKLSREQWFEKNKEKEWFVNMPKLFNIKTNCAIRESDKEKLGDGNWEYRPDSHYAECCLYLKTDDGNKMQLSAFWTGYFESLDSAEIEVDNSDMKIIF